MAPPPVPMKSRIRVTYPMHIQKEKESRQQSIANGWRFKNH